MFIHTERHVTYQFMLQFSSNTKTEAEGNRKGYHVLLTMTHVLAVHKEHQDHALQDAEQKVIGHT